MIRINIIGEEMIRIHMGEGLEDIQIDAFDENGNTFIRLLTDNTPGGFLLTPEGARSLAFTIIGMTDEMRRNNT